MKVILLTDVPKIGNRYDIKEFKDGYAINVLISKGLAVLATKSELTKLEQIKEQITKRKNESEKTIEDLMILLSNKTIIIKAKANDKGHLFKAVNSKEIVEEIFKALNIELEENFLEVGSIKEIGTHKIKIKNGHKVGECTIVIEAEK